jgi:hypothetical protein
MVTTPSFLDTLKREAGAAADSILGVPSALYHAAADPETPEESAAYGKGFESKIGPTGRLIDRTIAQPVEHAVSDYAHGRVNIDNALSVAPEAIGTAGGSVAGGKAIEAGYGKLAGEHPAVATQAVAEHANTGGSTFEPTTGKNLAGTNNAAVGIAPEHAVISDRPFNAQQYQEFVATHRDLLAKNPKVAVGTHFDPATGLHRMELVGLTPSRAAATSVGASLGEGSVYDLATDEQIPTGHDPNAERTISPTSVDQRMADLHANTPQKSPYTGVHYADGKLDMIDGARRGVPGANGIPSAEAARLRMGSQTGMGEDAPAGFYTHKAGSLPSADMAAKANAYKVRGQMAFASTDSSEFQNGYADGVQKAVEAGADPQTAHKLGLNAAENAVKNSGYDGYFSPKHPNLRFHFGSTEAIPHGPSVAPDLGDWQAPKTVKLSDGTTDLEPAVRNSENRIDTDAFAKATEQARAELGPNATAKDVIARRDQIVGGQPETRDVGAQSRANNPEPTRAEARGKRLRERTPEENADTSAFQQARRELGGGATSDAVVARAEQILGRPGAYSMKEGPENITPNGSGDSTASAEAISRQASNKTKGVKYLRRDTRSGAEMPLIGPDALDTNPGPYDVIVQRSPQGDVELARGAHAR